MKKPRMTLNEIYGLGKEQHKTELCRFMRDMKRAGFKQRIYRDKAKWRRPAVVCQCLHDVYSLLKETAVDCLTASKKEGRILVFPRQGL